MTSNRSGVVSRYVVYFCSDLQESGHGIIEEAFVSLTEVGFGCPVWIQGVLVFHTAAPANIKVATEEALIAKISLGSREVSFLL